MISVESLGISFDRQKSWVFRELTLTVPAGKSAAIVGPSGCGKSTLLKAIANLEAPTEGQVRLGSANVGMLFQKNALFNSLSVEENLLFPLRERKGLTGREAKQRAERFLESVGLSGTAELFPDELSGGMQKRLGIARALIVEPEILLYDDPTAGLDPITSRKIAELIRGLQKESGTTFIAVTNDMARAYQLGDQVYLLAGAKLVPGGTPEEIRESRDPSIRQFIYGLREGPLS